MVAAILPLQLHDLLATTAALADRLDAADPAMRRQVPVFRERMFARAHRMNPSASVQPPPTVFLVRIPHAQVVVMRAARYDRGQPALKNPAVRSAATPSSGPSRASLNRWGRVFRISP